MRDCVCDSCGMEFKINHLDTDIDTMKNGYEVEVISFTCPKCDEKYIVAVRDEESARLQKDLQAAQVAYKKSYDPKDDSKQRTARNEVRYRKKVLMTYMSKLKKKYLKELKKRGK